MTGAESLAARAVVCAVMFVLSGCVGEIDEPPAGPAAADTEMEPAPMPDEEPRIVGVENPQTERLPLLNPGGVDGTRGPR